MNTHTRTPITGHSSDHPEAEAEAAMCAAWGKLHLKQRPQKPAILSRLMISNFVAPQPDFAPSPSERFALERKADMRLKTMVSSAKAYRGEIDQSANWHVLLSLMEERLPAGEQGDAAAAKLVEIEAAIETLANAPWLPPRPNHPRPPSVQDPLTRIMVNAVYWYVDRFDPTAPARMLAGVTIRALGYNPNSLERHIEEVRKNGEWKNPNFGWYDSWSMLALGKLAA